MLFAACELGIALFAALILFAAFFLTPLYVMVSTSLKSMDEIRNGTLQLRMVPIGDTFSRFRRVVRDTAPPAEEVGTMVTEGFRLSLVRFQAEGERLTVAASLPKAAAGTVPVPPLFTWPTWEQPTYHRVRKQSFDLVKACLRQLPD